MFSEPFSSRIGTDRNLLALDHTIRPWDTRENGKPYFETLEASSVLESPRLACPGYMGFAMISTVSCASSDTAYNEPVQPRVPTKLEPWCHDRRLTFLIFSGQIQQHVLHGSSCFVLCRLAPLPGPMPVTMPRLSMSLAKTTVYHAPPNKISDVFSIISPRRTSPLAFLTSPSSFRETQLSTRDG